MVTKALDKAKDKACSGPYVAETEALEFVMRQKPSARWWMQSKAAAYEAQAMLRIPRTRDR